MGKERFFQQLSLDEATAVDDDYEDLHFTAFWELLFNELLSNVKNVPFDKIINNDLLVDNATVYRTTSANSIDWHYTADRKPIRGRTIFSFRFPNVCNPELYETFGTGNHYLFNLSPNTRHRSQGWYEFTDRVSLHDVDACLRIAKVIQRHHTTKIFVNAKQERLDIVWDFRPAVLEQIVITFESGSPSFY